MSLPKRRSDQASGADAHPHVQARHRALGLLARREHSARQLVDKLRRKGCGREVAERAVDELRESGLQSDERFAEALVHRRVERGYGPMYIRSELRQSGVADEIADELLTQTGDYWLAVAQRAHARKYQDRATVTWDTQARYLARRGFPADLIYRALGRQDD